MSGADGGIVPRHTSMPARKQKTPHGDVILTSKWKGDHYMLMASAPSREALCWMFPMMEAEPERHGNAFRHAFAPDLTPVFGPPITRERAGVAWML